MMKDLTSAECYRRLVASPAILSARYFFDCLLVNKHSLFEEYISKISTGKTPPKSTLEYYDCSDISWFKPADIGKETYLNEAGDYISKIAINDKKATFFEKGTLLITCIGDIGRIGVLKKNASANQQITGVLTNAQLLPEFAYLYLASHREIFTDSGVLETTLPIINQKKIRSLPIKVPHTDIQKVVIKFYFNYMETSSLGSVPMELEFCRDQLISFSKQVDSSKEFSRNITTELTHQQTLLKKLRQQILQEAIEGKLTTDWREQNPDVEPASELLTRIKAEKEQLIKDKKIKKQKVSPPISDEEKPFDLPDGWEWSRLGEICSKTGSGSTPSGGKSAYVKDGVKFVRSQNVYNDGFRWNEEAYISEQIHKKMIGTELFPEDLLLNITGGSIGRCCILPENFDTANINQHVAIIRSVNRKIGYFLHKVICSIFFQNAIIDAQTGAGREGLPKNKMDNMLIPLPPFPEQKAIVTKVEKLLALCDQLETQITSNQTHAKQLMQAVLKEAFSSHKNKEIN